MQRRTTVLDLFSTFIQFSEDRFGGWARDLRLQRAMEMQLQQRGRDSRAEGFWALHWYHRWREQSHRQAAEHLSAYLQEPCSWAMQNVMRRFGGGQWSLADGFQSVIANIHRILKGYRPDYGSQLKVYARTAFDNMVRDQLRQQQEVHICSDWGQLRRRSWPLG